MTRFRLLQVLWSWNSWWRSLGQNEFTRKKIYVHYRPVEGKRFFIFWLKNVFICGFGLQKHSPNYYRLQMRTINVIVHFFYVLHCLCSLLRIGSLCWPHASWIFGVFHMIHRNAISSLEVVSRENRYIFQTEIKTQVHKMKIKTQKSKKTKKQIKNKKTNECGYEKVFKF